MPIFDNASVEQVRNANDIVDVIGASVPLKRAGAAFVALCPFHKEKSPSFHVNPQKQIFHCFGCQKGGDIFTWVREYEGLTFPEAVQRLAQRAGITLQTSSGPDQEQTAVKQKLFAIHEQITQRWHSALLNEAAGQAGRDYLAKRGVTAEAVKIFKLGFAPEMWDDTVNWARIKGHDLALVEQCGLILKKEESDHYYDRFRGRLMFPIADEQGRVVAFSGRTLNPDEERKYVNSPETLLFKKSRILFALDKSKRGMLDAKAAVICEGQLDAIACFMAGVTNVVAPQGTAFTGDHARILKRYVDEVILCFDADNAGQKAAVRALDDLVSSGLSVRVANIPPPHDPDSFIKEFGADAFKKLIAKSEGYFDFYLNRLCATNDLSTDKGKLAVARAMAEGVRKTGSDVLIDTYIRKSALKLGVAIDSVRREFARAPQRAVREDTAPTSAPQDVDAIEPLPPPGSPEFWLLRLLMHADDHIQWAVEHLDVEWIQNNLTKYIVCRCFDLWFRQEWPGVAGFTLLLDEKNPAASKLLTQAVCEQRPLGNSEEVLKGSSTQPGLVARIRDKFIDRQSAALAARLDSPETSPEDRLNLLQERMRLRQMKGQPLARLGEA